MQVNKLMKAKLEIAIRVAKKGKKEKDVITAVSLTDRSSKKHIIHKNKAAHIKSALSKLLPKKSIQKVKSSKKASKKKK